MTNRPLTNNRLEVFFRRLHLDDCVIMRLLFIDLPKNDQKMMQRSLSKHFAYFSHLSKQYVWKLCSIVCRRSGLFLR